MTKTDIHTAVHIHLGTDAHTCSNTVMHMSMCTHSGAFGSRGYEITNAGHAYKLSTAQNTTVLTPQQCSTLADQCSRSLHKRVQRRCGRTDSRQSIKRGPTLKLHRKHLNFKASTLVTCGRLGHLGFTGSTFPSQQKLHSPHVNLQRQARPAQLSDNINQPTHSSHSTHQPSEHSAPDLLLKLIKPLNPLQPKRHKHTKHC
jgi:hypothetical protein